MLYQNTNMLGCYCNRLNKSVDKWLSFFAVFKLCILINLFEQVKKKLNECTKQIVKKKRYRMLFEYKDGIKRINDKKNTCKDEYFFHFKNRLLHVAGKISMIMFVVAGAGNIIKCNS